jgi:asparagine synthetase B (glutamine-hydrolysing)
MCGFTVYLSQILPNLSSTNLDKISYYIKNRGPDLTNVRHSHGWTFIHYLLQITGEKTPQPFASKDNEIMCLYNGEIYNYEDYGSFKSDGYCIIQAYKKYGTTFSQHLDGEYAIVLFDFCQNQIILSSDLFAIKPMYMYIRNTNFIVSSCQSAIQSILEIANVKYKNDHIIKMPPNKIHVLDLTTFHIKQKHTIYKWNLKQHKTSYEDWIKAFDRAIYKRTKNLSQSVFISLSSGYDSGCIACSLQKHKIPFKTYTFESNENLKILKKRRKRHHKKNNTILSVNLEEYKNSYNKLRDKCEPCQFTILKSLTTQKGKHKLDNGLMGIYDTHYPITNKDIRKNIIHIEHAQLMKVNWGNRKLIYWHNAYKYFKQDTFYMRCTDKNHIKLFYDVKMKKPVSFPTFSEPQRLCPIFEETYIPKRDWASIGLYNIFIKAQNNNQLICLSGQGADEIYSDYGYDKCKFKEASYFGGRFPEKLEHIFPWPSFYKSIQECLINKEESVTGALGIEGRYPYLDKDVVQEFLWLTSVLKNKHYKAPLHCYMNTNEYPFAPNEKRGFKPLILNKIDKINFLNDTLLLESEKDIKKDENIDKIIKLEEDK